MECEVGGRQKRSPVELHNASSIVHDYDSQLALRVVGLKDHPSSILDDEFLFDYPGMSAHNLVNRTSLDSGNMSCNEKMFATGLGGGCVMLLICGLALALYTYIKQGRMQNNRKSNPTSGSPSSAATPYRYPPPSGRQMVSPYQKPLPPPPTTSTAPPSLPPHSTAPRSTSNGNDSSISQVEKLLKELVKNNCDNTGGKTSKTKGTGSSKHKEPPSEYACIDETNSSSSAASSSEDLRKSKRAKDGVYILYCYDKDKKNKQKMHPMSAPLRRKQIKQMGRVIDDDDDYYDDEKFGPDGDDDSEALGSQPEATDESDEYGEIGNNRRNVNNNNVKHVPCNIVMNPVVRRTVREVKKKSKQNNVLAYASTRSRGNLRRRISSVYREGYFNGLRGVVQAAVGSNKGGSALRYKKSPSTGNIPEALADGRDNGVDSAGGKRIHFSVRERRSERKRIPKHSEEQYSSEGGMLSEVMSDLDSAYSGSNCSKLTEAYEMKNGGGGGSTKNNVGPYPDMRKLQQNNRMDIQRQLMRSGAAQGQDFMGKQQLRRTTSQPNENGSAGGVAIGLGSPPLQLGETKATYFVTRDESTTKIIISPESHV